MMGVVMYSVLVVVVVTVRYFVAVANRFDVVVYVVLDRKVAVVWSIIVLVDS
jgi:hypothetical protein